MLARAAEKEWVAGTRCVIDHARTGRTAAPRSFKPRTSGKRPKATTYARNREGVRSPDPRRDRARNATSAFARPMTALAALPRDTIRLAYESPNAAGYGVNRVEVTAE